VEQVGVFLQAGDFSDTHAPRNPPQDRRSFVARKIMTRAESQLHENGAQRGFVRGRWIYGFFGQLYRGKACLIGQDFGWYPGHRQHMIN
jgi:hypothetical protein